MLYPFIFKNKYKLKCSREECINIIKKQFVESDQFKGRFHSWGFQLEKKLPLLSLTISEKTFFVVRGVFIDENDSIYLNIQVNMLQNLILLVAGIAFLIVLFFKVKPDQIISISLFLLLFVLTMMMFVIVTLNQEKEFMKRFEKVIPAKYKS